jgi:hypothetical protein
LSEFLAPLLVVHGLAHLVGFVGPWRLLDVEGVTFQNSLFDGRLAVSGRTMRALGIGWLMLAAGFLMTGLAVTLELAWWSKAATVLISLSLMMCAAHWPAARVGAAVNVFLLVGLQVARASLWL